MQVSVLEGEKPEFAFSSLCKFSCRIVGGAVSFPKHEAKQRLS